MHSECNYVQAIASLVPASVPTPGILGQRGRRRWAIFIAHMGDDRHFAVAHEAGEVPLVDLGRPDVVMAPDLPSWLRAVGR